MSRWQRDLTDSTVLRNVGVAVSHALIAWRSIERGLERVDVPSAPPGRRSGLPTGNCSAEPIQTVMRRYGVENAYEQLKSLTRGQRVDAASLRQFCLGPRVAGVRQAGCCWNYRRPATLAMRRS